MAATKLLTILKMPRVNSLVDRCIVSEVADKFVILLSMIMMNHPQSVRSSFHCAHHATGTPPKLSDQNDFFFRLAWEQSLKCAALVNSLSDSKPLGPYRTHSSSLNAEAHLSRRGPKKPLARCAARLRPTARFPSPCRATSSGSHPLEGFPRFDAGIIDRRGLRALIEGQIVR